MGWVCGTTLRTTQPARSLLVLVEVLVFLGRFGASCNVPPKDEPPPTELHFCFRCDRDFQTRDPKRWCCVPCCGRGAKKVTRRCNWCERKFKTTDDTNGFCSSECRATARVSVAADRNVEMFREDELRKWERKLAARVPAALRKKSFRYGRNRLDDT